MAVDRAESVALLATASGPVALLTAWFLVPLGVFGPDQPVLGWTVFALALGLLAAFLLREIRREALGLPGRPARAILMLLCTALVIFATAYLTISRTPGELDGLHTKVDALYFTVITMATVGYGDIVPTGQTARVVVMLQIAYTVVFLTAGAAALNRRVKADVARRAGARPPEPDR
ncbi:potassium channel family protein [Kitasatospora camelliae]|uniref:Potassium channel family protein n=1 Tax=Kitasatospora camelliae TaxID=3156397 RepID=A0AAU8JX19_9ACTN